MTLSRVPDGPVWVGSLKSPRCVRRPSYLMELKISVDLGSGEALPKLMWQPPWWQPGESQSHCPFTSSFFLGAASTQSWHIKMPSMCLAETTGEFTC